MDRKVFCRLCICACIAGHQSLYDENGHKNEMYTIVAKYFEKELEKINCNMNHGASRVICDYCWKRIQEFHTWQEEVFEVQQRFESMSRLQFEEIVKMEMGLRTIATQAKEEAEVSAVSLTDVPAMLEKEIEFPLAELSSTMVHQENDTLADVDSRDKFADESANFEPSLDCIKNEPSSPDEVNVAKSDTDDVDRLLLDRVKVKAKIMRPKRCTNKAKVNQGALPAAPADDAENSAKIEEQQDRKHRNKTKEYDEFIAKFWKEELNCELCGATFGNFTKLRVHFRNEHNNENGYVTCCDHKYTQRFHLVEHLQLHRDPQSYKCTVCGKCSGTRRNLITHMKTMHGEEPLERRFECEVCHKRFAKKAIWRSHMEIHVEGSKDHICPHCNKGFVLKNRLDVHIRNVHSTANNCVCEHCGKPFRARHALNRHLLEHEGGIKRKWPCDLCQAELHSKFSLGRHKRLAHNDRSTLYVCSLCGKHALTVEALRSHKKYVHEKERTFKCNLCEKAFKSALVLKEHMTTHTGQDLYQCPHCPKTFKVSSNMHHHRKRVHPKEWAENRRRQTSKIDYSNVDTEVVL